MTLPVDPIHMPSVLSGQTPGQLDPGILVGTPGLVGGPTVWLVEPAARAWRAMLAAAGRAGHTLKATSAVDSYRPYEVQLAAFYNRYTTTPLQGRPSKTYQGRRWWLRPGMAQAANPGKSNHGRGIAVDTGEERDGNPQSTEPLDAATLGWLKANARAFGFSWEVQSEPWHLRYTRGDRLPAAVTAFEEGRPYTGSGGGYVNRFSAAPGSTDPGDGGPFPIIGPWWAPWNLPAVAGNATVDAGEQAGQGALAGVLGGARHLAIEGAAVVFGLALLAGGLYVLVRPVDNAARRRLGAGT